MLVAGRLVRTFPLLFLLCFAHYISAQSILGGSGSGSGSGLGNGLLTAIPSVGDLLNTDPVEHPRDIETRMLFGIGVCLQAAEVTADSGGAAANSYPWLGLMLEGGASFTYRDRISLSVTGAWGFNGYMLNLDTAFNRVYHSTKRAEARLAWHTRGQRKRPDQWRFGLAMGGTFQQADERTEVNGPFQAFTMAPALTRPYLAPEIGYMGTTGKDRVEMSFRYVIHLDNGPAWTSNATMSGSQASYAATDDHLALVTRYHIGFRRKEEGLSPLHLPEGAREQDTLSALRCKRERITLRLWDDAEVDGDTVSVLLNGRPVLVAHKLTHDPVKLRLDMRYGQNEVEVIAHNEGRISPNTARGIVRRGKGKERMLIKTYRTRSQLLMIERGKHIKA
jgi:hypothetical protein